MSRISRRSCSLLLLGLTLAASMAWAEEKEPHDSPPKTVTLTIDYGDGFQKRFPAIPHQQSMTVAEAMKFAQSHRRGIKCRIRGKAATAILLQIDDLQNQGGNRLNWVYRVNGKLGNTSFALAEVQPGDVILWKFEEYK